MDAWPLSAILGLFLLSSLQVESAGMDLDHQKVAGFWREVGVASHQNLVLKASKKVEGLFLTFSGKNLTVRAVYNSSGGCETENVVGLERDTPGVFAFPGHREIHVLDTDYMHYAILRMSLLWQGKHFYVLKYFTRSMENKDEPGFWKFREMTADTGLYIVAQHGRCAELLKEVSLCFPPTPARREPLLV